MKTIDDNFDILGFDPSELNIFNPNYKQNIKPVNVYLAGKIESCGWRQRFVDIRNNFFYDDNIDLKNAELVMDEHFIITGPFFLSCDHSCAHGEGSHGLGRNQQGCITACGPVYSEKEIIEICKRQIERADIVFAYIYDDTCFGSLFEIGYAKAIGKKIVCVFDKFERQERMWFITYNADICISLDVYKLKNTNHALYNKLRPRYLLDINRNEIDTELLIEKLL